MENYISDIENQFKIILTNSYTNIVIDEFENELFNIFKHIYLINFLKNRIELGRFFDTEYMNISISCIIESFSLLLNNYPRGSSLVLRSSLENFLKHLISKHNFFIEVNYTISDRNYTANKLTFETIIDRHFKEVFKSDGKSLNSKMESSYKKLSGISHSLVTESKNNLLIYFSDLCVINPNNISQVIDIYNKIIICIVENILILCEPSLKCWELMEVQKLLRIVFGSRKTKSYLDKIKY